jgi:hypothetical protein
MVTYTDARQIRVSCAVCEQAQVLAVLHLDSYVETILVGMTEEVVDRVKVAGSITLSQCCRRRCRRCFAGGFGWRKTLGKCGNMLYLE